MPTGWSKNIRIGEVGLITTGWSKNIGMDEDSYRVVQKCLVREVDYYRVEPEHLDRGKINLTTEWSKNIWIGKVG